MPTIKWRNLLDDQCPQCGSKLNYFDDRNMKNCTNMDCRFVISKNKFYNICENIERDEQKSKLEGFGF